MQQSAECTGLDSIDGEKGSPDLRKAWGNFLRYGGFPGIHYLSLEDEQVFTYLNSLYSTIVLKDVVNRHEIRELSLLDIITRFLFDNCGNITTASSVTAMATYRGCLRISFTWN